ncbi:MAG TPA: sugar ABC transporter ATP-binding protein [Candidatus Choladousia intestinigallinarum]|nr:sugar ABC transporter ATP-binding protein [Candidatus Choladousia intestinigallinarum]
MKEEVFRMDHVTTDDFETTNLDNMSLQIYKGEIVGLLPVNEQGRKKLIEVMCQNVPIHYGRIYIDGLPVNSYLKSDQSANRVSVISAQNRLVRDLTVSDNIFVLRRGFRQYIIQRKVLNREAKRLFSQNGIEIRPDITADKLTEFQRVVIELIKAVLRRDRLIIFDEISSFLSMKDILKLRDMMHHYSAQGFSFLYIGNHHEEVCHICGRVLMMKSGRIIKNIRDRQISAQDVLKIAGSEGYPELYVRLQNPMQQPEPPLDGNTAGNSVLELRNVTSSYFKHVSFSVHPGECVVLLDRSMSLVEETLKIFTSPGTLEEGEILCGGRCLTREAPMRLLDDSIAVIQEYPHKSMIFPHLSFMENLSILSDRKISSLFLQKKVRKSIRREFEPVFGKDLDIRDMRTASKESKYSLVYYRYYMLRPKILICIRPFSGADMYLRRHILKLMQKLMERGIALLILTSGLADTYFVADRLLLLEKGHLVCEFPKENFKDLWTNLLQNQ